ncbi:MAG TPA: L-histidine N(alpha)-methyltransferase [Actinomycetota bacterium]|nr:L-histidine N(alpha)-methyltransferase [Actinomycetota bacterium]
MQTLLRPGDLEAQLRADALEGLTSTPKRIPSKWFYDYAGSLLFDQITRLPEYYLTRCERQILRERAAAIVDETSAEVLVELGCGLSEKTKILLDAFRRRGSLGRFVPFDVDGEVLAMAAGQLTERYPGLEVEGIVGDFERHLSALSLPGRTLVLFLGSTIGNLGRCQRAALLAQLSASLDPGDWFLLGVDLVKDVDVIEAAYNDSAGISAAFNLNMLSVLNARLEADFDLPSFLHLARFNRDTEQMEMFLRSACDQTVRLHAIDLEVEFAEGELLHTEISAKFRREGLEAELRASGLEPRRWWTDSERNFAVCLSEKPR